MRFVKSVGVGLVAAILAAIGAVFVLMLAGYAYVWVQMAGGSGDIGGYSSGLELPLLAGLAAGITGFVWQWRRGRRALPM